MTRHAWIYLCALLLPLVFLGLETALHLGENAGAKPYRVVAEGYDPRDLVYGEYLQFRLNWEDARSEKPAGVKDLPDTARLYLPEGNARDLQSMLWERRHTFIATVILRGGKASVRDLAIDGKPWPGGLAAWRAARPAEPPRP